VRVQCRRKESSRSLSHLLMSFLIIVLLRCLSSLCTCTFVTCYIKYQSINQCTYLDLDSAAVHVDKWATFRRHSCLLRLLRSL